MCLVSIAVQAVGIGKYSIGEVVILINEEINLPVHFGTFHIKVFQLIDCSVFRLHLFFYPLRQIIGIDITEIVKNNAAMVVQALAIVVQFGTYQ